jgi:hypothetical protein
VLELHTSAFYGFLMRREAFFACAGRDPYGEYVSGRAAPPLERPELAYGCAACVLVAHAWAEQTPHPQLAVAMAPVK